MTESRLRVNICALACKMYRCGCPCAKDGEMIDLTSVFGEDNVEPDLRTDIRCACRACGPRRRGYFVRLGKGNLRCARRCRTMCHRVLVMATFQAVGEMIVHCGVCREWCVAAKRRRHHCKAKATGKAKGKELAKETTKAEAKEAVR